jgi:serine/threonine-protein kinase
VTELTDTTVVDGRYRILGRIGAGGMADVYRAEDTHLGREVALKVLHRRFAQDAEFVERFRREASAAAGLSHPNVVGVFDRGEHAGTYYIAMECLAGRTLKQVVAEEAPLDQERAIDLGVQILAAAGFAHRRGIIHRDFKPHNVIVDDAGAAKVTDFGIARAGASEMTETGSIMGTAHYLSPEQAQGHAVTASSDLYSIGVMLFELLTGQLPFAGDSAVSVALKHLSEPPPPISQLRPDIDPTLEQVVMAALAKDPASRWQSAEEFAAALEAARTHVQAGANGGETGQATAAFAPVPVPTPPGAPPARGDRERRRWPAFALALLVLALIGAVAWALSRPEEVTVPNVVNQPLLEAQQRLERAGFDDVEVERVRHEAEIDTVVDQDPNGGDRAPEGDTVTLTVSQGPGQVRVPSVRGSPRERAFRELERAGLKVTADPQPSNTVPEGTVIGTSPREGTLVDRGSRVRLFISSGKEQVRVPDVVGLTSSSAERQLQAAGLEVAVTETESEEPDDQVVRQSPAGGAEVESGTRVTITVSKGPGEVTVPDVAGLDAGVAARRLRRAGLSVDQRTQTVSDPTQDGIVLEQRPGGSAKARRGDNVVIVVGRLQTETTPPATPPAG